MTEEKMTAEQAFEQLHICQEDEPYIAIIRTELEELRAENEALKQRYGAYIQGSAVVIPGQDYLEMVKECKELRAKLTGEADGFCAWHPEYGFDANTFDEESKNEALSNLRANHGPYRVRDGLTEEMIMKQIHDYGWRVVPVKIVRVGE